jgi:DNA mismatch endonuclease (patch repair protein)
MSDVFSKAKRSAVMGQIRSRGNSSTEIAFMRLLRQHRVSGWRRHRSLTLLKIAHGTRTSENRKPCVKPDFVFHTHRVAVFIDGCFWHGCPRHGTKPEGNADFWKAKLLQNQARDRYVTRMLLRQNWKVVRIWEHQLKKGDMLMTRLKRQMASFPP